MSTVRINRPEAEERQSVTLEAGSSVAFAFNAATASVDRVDNDLVFRFDNGAETRIQNFFVTDGKALPDFVLEDGTEVAGVDLLRQLNDAMDIETAAGPSAGSNGSGGVGDYADDAGALISGVDRLGSLGTIQWSRATEAPEFMAGLAPAGTDAPAAPFTPPVNPPVTPPDAAPENGVRAVLYMHEYFLSEGDSGAADTVSTEVFFKNAGGERLTLSAAEVSSFNGAVLGNGAYAVSVAFPEGMRPDWVRLSFEGGRIVIGLTPEGLEALTGMKELGENLINYFRVTVTETVSGETFEYPTQVVAVPGQEFNSFDQNGRDAAAGLPELNLAGEYHSGAGASRPDADTSYHIVGSDRNDEIIIDQRFEDGSAIYASAREGSLTGADDANRIVLLQGVDAKGSVYDVASAPVNIIDSSGGVIEIFGNSSAAAVHTTFGGKNEISGEHMIIHSDDKVDYGYVNAAIVSAYGGENNITLSGNLAVDATANVTFAGVAAAIREDPMLCKDAEVNLKVGGTIDFQYSSDVNQSKGMFASSQYASHVLIQSGGNIHADISAENAYLAFAERGGDVRIESGGDITADLNRGTPHAYNINIAEASYNSNIKIASAGEMNLSGGDFLARATSVSDIRIESGKDMNISLDPLYQNTVAYAQGSSTVGMVSHGDLNIDIHAPYSAHNRIAAAIGLSEVTIKADGDINIQTSDAPRPGDPVFGMPHATEASIAYAIGGTTLIESGGDFNYSAGACSGGLLLESHMDGANILRAGGDVNLTLHNDKDSANANVTGMTASEERSSNEIIAGGTVRMDFTNNTGGNTAAMQTRGSGSENRITAGSVDIDLAGNAGNSGGAIRADNGGKNSIGAEVEADIDLLGVGYGIWTSAGGKNAISAGALADVNIDAGYYGIYADGVNAENTIAAAAGTAKVNIEADRDGMRADSGGKNVISAEKLVDVDITTGGSGMGAWGGKGYAENTISSRGAAEVDILAGTDGMAATKGKNTISAEMFADVRIEADGRTMYATAHDFGEKNSSVNSISSQGNLRVEIVCKNGDGMYAHYNSSNTISGNSAEGTSGDASDSVFVQGALHSMYASEGYTQNRIATGAGADKVSLVGDMEAKNGGLNLVETGRGGDSVYVEGDMIANKIVNTNLGRNVIASGEGDDTLRIVGGMFGVAHGDRNPNLLNDAEIGNLIDTGAGNDTVWLQGGMNMPSGFHDGNDYRDGYGDFSKGNPTAVTNAANAIRTGAGDDTVRIDGDLSSSSHYQQNLVDTGDGNDVIRLGGKVGEGGLTLRAGEGYDTLILEAGSVDEFNSNYKDWLGGLTGAQFDAMGVESIKVAGIGDFNPEEMGWLQKIAADHNIIFGVTNADGEQYNLDGVLGGADSINTLAGLMGHVGENTHKLVLDLFGDEKDTLDLDELLGQIYKDGAKGLDINEIVIKAGSNDSINCDVTGGTLTESAELNNGYTEYAYRPSGTSAEEDALMIYIQTSV